MNKIQNFQTFSQLKTQLKEQAAKKEMATKREAAVTEYNELLSKYNVSKITELSEKDRAIFLAELTKEGNAFGAARAKAIAKGDKEFKIHGDTVPVTKVDKQDKDNAEEFVDYSDGDGEAPAYDEDETDDQAPSYDEDEDGMYESTVTEAKMDKEFAAIAATVKKHDLFMKIANELFPEIAKEQEGGKLIDFYPLSQKQKDQVYAEFTKLVTGKLGESVVTEAGSFVGWIAIFNGKKLEIDKSEADGIYNAKLLAIKKLNVPKSKLGLLSISPAVDESIVTEGKDDYVARYSGTNITLKKGYKHLNDEELNQLYLEIGELIADNKLKVKDATLTFESAVTESELSLKSNLKLYKKVEDKLKGQKYNKDAEYHLTLLKAMNPKKLSASDLDTLSDFDDLYESVVTEAVSSKDEKSIEDFIKSAIGKKVKLTTKEFDGESDVEDKFTKASWGNNVYKVDYMSIDFDQELDAIKRGSGKILKLDKNTFKWNLDGPKGTDITIEIK